MAETKTDRLGLRGTLALLESAYRLVGAANATGAIAAGAAFHAFEKYSDVQSFLKIAAFLFLLGVLCFAFVYAIWLFGTIELDQSLYRSDEARSEDVFLARSKQTQKELQKSTRKHFVIAILLALLS